MRLELAADGYDVYFVAVNVASGDNAKDREALTKRTSFAVLQDVAEVDAWNLHHHGHKDDLYVYDAKGTLSQYLPMGGEIVSDLSTDEGYANLRKAVLAAHE